MTHEASVLAVPFGAADDGAGSMTQPLLDFASAPKPSQAETMAPSAVQARRSGRQRGIANITTSMAAYRDCLLAHAQGLTDHDAADLLGWPLSVVNARRGDWELFRPGAVVAASRMRKAWRTGKSTTRTVWRWQP